MPLAPPSSFSLSSSAAGLNASPSTAAASPASNSISMVVGRSGAAWGETERVNMLSSGPTHGSSSALPS